jgi:HAD superfamily hydrolase (TIGR01509 family)
MSTPEWAGYLVSLGIGMTSDAVVAEVVRRVSARYGDAPPLLAGAAGVVWSLAARWQLGLASSSPRDLIHLVLDRTGLGAAFAAVVSSEEVARGKPAPDVYLEAARRLRVPSRDCIAVEDSANGIRAATAAGMRVAAVPNPHYPPDHDALALAALRVDRISQLTPQAVDAVPVVR